MVMHFHSKRPVNPNEIKVRLNGFEMLPQPLIKWLQIYLDPKLTFHVHVERKVCEATRAFHQIEKLSNTERELSSQAIRHLQIACITSVADYGVPVWWRGQRYLEGRYQKLQNLALILQMPLRLRLARLWGLTPLFHLLDVDSKEYGILCT